MKRKKLWIVHQDKRYPLSVGNLVETLQGAGIATELAIEISRQTEKALQEDGQKNVKLKQVLQRIAKRLQKEVDNETVERFLAQTPPFVPISVERISTDETEDSSIVAFSRRLLANSLAKLSLSFKEANKIAIQIEQQLRTQGYEKVGERELVHMVAVALEATYGRDLRLRYEQQLSNPISFQISKEDKVIPFSQGILASSLMMIGLEPVEAHSFAKQCEDRLWQKGLFRVSKKGLRKEVRDLLDAELGSTFARRYDLMKNVRNPEKPLIILIGGAPGVGKSTLAYELAYRLGIQRIVSSDAVREALRSLISPQLSPTLHLSSFLAWQAFVLPEEAMKAKPKRVIRGFQSQVQQLGNALRAIIDRSVVEAKSVILEGVYLVPGMLPLETIQEATLIELVIALDNPEDHKTNFERRHEETKALRSQSQYLDYFDEIRIIQDFIMARAEAEDVAILRKTNLDGWINESLDLIMNAILLEDVESLSDE